MSKPNIPLDSQSDIENNSTEEYNATPKKDIKLNIGERQISMRLGCSAFLILLVVLYFIVVMPGIVSHYFSGMNNQTIVMIILFSLLLLAIIFVAALWGNSTSANMAEKDEFTRVNNEYYIRKQLTEKKNANTSVDADSGRCSICGAKVSRTNTNCPKCGRIIR